MPGCRIDWLPDPPSTPLLPSSLSPFQFARLLEVCAPELTSRGLVPLLFGAAAEADYAREVTRRVRAAAPDAIVLNHHLGPEELAAVFSTTALNVHPSKYDAYGMSIVEAAAFGAPSLVNGGGTVGATALLGTGVGCIAADLEAPDTAIAARLLESLDDHATLSGVAYVARERALGWGEDAAGRRLHEAIIDVTQRNRGSSPQREQ
jgi:hypothetical protein